MMPFWCACWIAWQTWMNTSSRSRVESCLLVAVFGDRDALTSSITKYGRPVSVAPASSTLGDVRMIHHRQRLPLGLKSGDHLPGVHAELDDLERHPAPDRLRLLGHVHDAHAAFADLLQQLVGADDRSGPFADRRRLALSLRPPRGLQRSASRKISPASSFALKQLLDPPAQFGRRRHTSRPGRHYAGRAT